MEDEHLGDGRHLPRAGARWGTGAVRGRRGCARRAARVGARGPPHGDRFRACRCAAPRGRARFAPSSELGRGRGLAAPAGRRGWAGGYGGRRLPPPRRPGGSGGAQPPMAASLGGGHLRRRLHHRRLPRRRSRADQADRKGIPQPRGIGRRSDSPRRNGPALARVGVQDVEGQSQRRAGGARDAGRGRRSPSGVRGRVPGAQPLRRPRRHRRLTLQRDRLLAREAAAGGADGRGLRQPAPWGKVERASGGRRSRRGVRARRPVAPRQLHPLPRRAIRQPAGHRRRAR